MTVGKNTAILHECRSHKTITGSSRWTVGAQQIGKHEGHQSLCQSSAVMPTVSGSFGIGAYAVLKEKRYYDFVLETDVLASGPGSIGVAFRVKDRKNMYLFEMRQVKKWSSTAKSFSGVIASLHSRGMAVQRGC